MEISVLDRQKAVLMQRLYQNQTTTPHHHHQILTNQDIIIDHYNNNNNNNVMMQSRFPLFDDHHHRSNNNCNNSPAATTRVEMSNHHCSNSTSFVSRDTNNSNNANCSIKKRKAEYDVQKQEEQEEADESPSQSQSAITTKNNEKANSSDKSKVSDGQQKPDYIHVRARRGQATDSHSLAERARREKISKKMKCLQDLVPGCNRATGKAGMLDEIINYVQSLQKQVEFLSMKLAVLNPRLDFSIDDFFAKEMPAYIASLPTATHYEATDPTASFAHNNITSSHGFDIAMNQPQKVSPSSLASAMQIPEAFLDPSFIHQLQHMSGLESEFPNLYSMGLH